MSGAPDPPPEEREEEKADKKLPLRSLPLPQREVAILIVLFLISAATFAATRRMAGWSRERSVETAAMWFARGEEKAQAGDLDEGIAALREAVAEERQNPIYVLALSRRLAQAHRDDEARQLLLQLRQSQPDDVEVNYGLARLAALDGDTADAIRYYNYAMYGLVRIGIDYDRRAIRTELIEFLLDQGQTQEALTELEALGRELPDEVDAQLEAARLADRAGDARQAFERYQRAASIAPDNAEAAAGAGQTAYALHDFATAVRELARSIDLNATAPELAQQLEVSRLVLANDPLGPKVASATRAARLKAGMSRAIEHFDACLVTETPAPADPDPTRVELGQLNRSRASALQDPDVLARGVSLIGEVEASVRSRCPERVEALDRAWTFIAELHPSGGQ